MKAFRLEGEGSDLHVRQRRLHGGPGIAPFDADKRQRRLLLRLQEIARIRDQSRVGRGEHDDRERSRERAEILDIRPVVVLRAEDDEAVGPFAGQRAAHPGKTFRKHRAFPPVFRSAGRCGRNAAPSMASVCNSIVDKLCQFKGEIREFGPRLYVKRLHNATERRHLRARAASCGRFDIGYKNRRNLPRRKRARFGSPWNPREKPRPVYPECRTRE